MTQKGKKLIQGLLRSRLPLWTISPGASRRLCKTDSSQQRKPGIHMPSLAVGCSWVVHKPWPFQRAPVNKGLRSASENAGMYKNRGASQGGTSGNEPACQHRRHKRCGFDPWVRKIPWRRAWQPTPVFLPGDPSGQRSRGGYSP